MRRSTAGVEHLTLVRYRTIPAGQASPVRVTIGLNPCQPVFSADPKEPFSFSGPTPPARKLIGTPASAGRRLGFSMPIRIQSSKTRASFGRDFCRPALTRSILIQGYGDDFRVQTPFGRSGQERLAASCPILHQGHVKSRLLPGVRNIVDSGLMV